MKTNRRKFLGSTFLASIASIGAVRAASRILPVEDNIHAAKKPVVISTWNFGVPANKEAWKVLANNGRALDAVEKGVNVIESDPKYMSVGYGGLPDRDGNVTLDACIMDEHGNCGSVGFLQYIKNPISVARKVMEETPHIMLVGAGALKFALQQGFKKENLLTYQARQRWMNWVEESGYKNMPIDKNNHDTIGMLAIDNDGNLSGACTTSGLAWKLHGRVGDSPIIGAGLYVDNEIGAAAATGKGEAVIKEAGTFLIVELMRQGHSPQKACEIAVDRIIRKQKDHKDFQVGFLALNKSGQVGAFSIEKGFQYALNLGQKTELLDSAHRI